MMPRIGWCTKRGTEQEQPGFAVPLIPIIG
jgi:hypothetical protein